MPRTQTDWSRLRAALALVTRDVPGAKYAVLDARQSGFVLAGVERDDKTFLPTPPLDVVQENVSPYLVDLPMGGLVDEIQHIGVKAWVGGDERPAQLMRPYLPTYTAKWWVGEELPAHRWRIVRQNPPTKRHATLYYDDEMQAAHKAGVYAVRDGGPVQIQRWHRLLRWQNHETLPAWV